MIQAPLSADDGLPIEDEVRVVSRTLATASPDEVLRWGIQRFGSALALCTSFQAEGMVLLDMAVRLDRDVRVFTIDTGRLPEETYALMERVRERYGIAVGVYYPDGEEVSRYVSREGVNAFYRSAPLRLRCCDLRKTRPLQRALSGLEAWVTGLRRDQAETRTEIPTVQIDPRRPGLVKLNPLARWHERDVWEYIRRHEVPYNTLYDRGFRSIGCAPCTRACAPGEDARAGRWWWEENVPKECGIHWGPR